MTPESFHALADALDEALLLLSPDGVVRAVNNACVAEIGIDDKDELIGRKLSTQVEDPEEHVASLLRSGRRTTGSSIGAIRFRNHSQSSKVIVNRLKHGGDGVYMLMRVQAHESAFQKFSVLNEQLELLGREIARRRLVEGQLRGERDNAAFGRDVGIALVHAQGLDEALARCTDLMVDRLDAAFARIWLANKEKTELRLTASSGMYTHLDGEHSRIRFGEHKIGRIAAGQQPHITNRVVGDSQIHDQAWAQSEGMVAFVGYPLIDEGSTVGVMALFSRKVLNESIANAMASVANSIALRVRKQTVEDGLAEQTLELKVADRRKDEFLAMLSHELRNPLAPVRSGLDLLSLDGHEHSDTIQLMQQQVEHLVRLVDDLLDVSRIMRGKVELRKQPVEVAPLINRACDTLRDTLESQQHQLTVHLPEQPIWVDADAVRIIQVIENLLKNACKYTDCGGEIAIHVSEDRESVSIEIIDNGIGIDAELLDKVFELFTQADRALDRSQGGLGIGLTLVKNLVEMHGGEVNACSDGLGCGSKFTVRLSTCSPIAAKKDSSGSDDVVVAPLRILAVDDNRAARLMLSTLLGKLGSHTIETAEDGLTALEAFDRFQPHLVLLDIGLPGMNGFEVARTIRQEPANDSCLLVALTGYGQQEDRRKSQEAGFDQHLVKPLSVDQLREVLRHPKLQSKKYLP